MSANIAIIGSKSAIAAYGETPWHGLGQKLEQPATAAEAITAASLDWDVAKVPLYLGQGDQFQRVSNRHAIVRQNLLNEPEPVPLLGIVGSEYKALQNRDAFAWFDPIVGQGAAIYHTAGALGDGERIWILAKLPDDLRVIGDDIAHKYLLLSNSHDGNSSVQVKFTPVRVVCQNTLTLALRDGNSIRIPHTRNLSERLAAARDALGIIHRRFETITADFQAMAKISMLGPRLQNYVASVFPLPANPDDHRARFRVDQARQESARLFEDGMGNSQSGVHGTLWAAYNGVAEYVDHTMRYRDADRRLDAIWFGSGYLSKARAYRLAVDSAAAWKN